MKVIYYEIEEIPSTNTMAKSYMHLWDPYALTVISTKCQTAGTGKFGKSWKSSKGDLLNTFCFFITDLHIDVSRLFRLGTEAVVALCKDLGITEAKIKWPNDVLVHGEKLCGVLPETLPVEGLLGVVLGIGLNGNTTKQALKDVGQPATSLQEILGHPIDLETTRELLIHHLLGVLQENLPDSLATKSNRGNI
ncbi:BirA [Chlamydia pneumoniae TW-183]|uniref:Biotin Synthetase n=2 Tax=Chlamydia pneumoniae TaxID=83558 RepID=Q9Z740_CHLPN|nr:biotin--[acetyl-CoA-carboxylase] ligase [Chlamydia pneumoniae]AAD19004.1 Biotin Synthetase [Chlamydia pneumoniae CWL029]AAF38781.1 BirA-related protein [Chlamydia pneumoniae AR39]AAP98824.1 BirA [Chlamydia pneumoniae TW-183]ACZ32751.1 putative biotin-[acetyl-CoA-carboxylase] ligase [Chlamydia pneumoniae LPCoLN]ETR79627.1 Biotin-protein ligase [Chlamydia pneumoniae B21]